MAWLAMNFNLSFYSVVQPLTSYRKIQTPISHSDNTLHWHTPMRGTEKDKEGTSGFFSKPPNFKGKLSHTSVPILCICPSAQRGWCWKIGSLCNYFGPLQLSLPLPQPSRISSLELWWGGVGGRGRRWIGLFWFIFFFKKYLLLYI